ncbi:MAG: phosphatase [Lachnospiraceae bacterium]|nr:phosphatase [Lachnospiraceae bacterium]
MSLCELTPEVDTHTHTVISGHAWSTLTENCLAAKARGMKGLCLTEHGPAIEGGAPEYIPHSQRMLPDEIDGIRVYRGIEANVLDHQNHLDIPEHYLKFCEFAIASIHTHMFPERADRDANTATYLAMLQNPYIDMLGHPDDPSVPCDFEAIVEEAGKCGKLLEFNNNSTTAHRPGSLPSLKEYILCCRRHGQRVCVSSDAHFHTMIGNVKPILTLMDELDFPQELIVNLTQERFEAYLAERKQRISACAE